MNIFKKKFSSIVVTHLNQLEGGTDYIHDQYLYIKSKHLHYSIEFGHNRSFHMDSPLK